MENEMVNADLATALIGYKDNIVANYVKWCEDAGIECTCQECGNRNDKFKKLVVNRTNIGKFGIEFEPGSKYVKVIKISFGGSRSVHSFVEKKTGDIWKAASWKAPAKNFVRGNVFDAGSYTNRLSWTGVL